MMYQHFGLTSGIMTIGFGITMWGKTIICKHELWFSSLCGALLWIAPRVSKCWSSQKELFGWHRLFHFGESTYFILNSGME